MYSYSGRRCNFSPALTGGKCEGETVQIYPSAKPCSALQVSLIKQGRTVAMLRDLPVIETKVGIRNLLIPTAGAGCVLVAVAVQQ
jgi:hypothetical protein